MTYDVLEKVSKKELIAWMRKNVFLPRNISDEEFLRRVKLDRLMAEEKELLDKNDSLIKQMEAAADKPIEFMKLWIESDKINERLNNISKNINKLMGLQGGVTDGKR